MPDNKELSPMYELRKHADELSRRSDLIGLLADTLVEANNLCRSFHGVAQRKGEKVNWEAIEERLGESLKKQHRVIHGHRGATG